MPTVKLVLDLTYKGSGLDQQFGSFCFQMALECYFLWNCKIAQRQKALPQKSFMMFLCTAFYQDHRCSLIPEVESRTQDSRPRRRTQKKSEAKAKDSLSDNRTSRGQGQECSRPRPRTEETGASVLLKKKVFKNIFQAISNSLVYPKFLIKEGLNHKSHDMTSSKFFQRGSFRGTKIS